MRRIALIPLLAAIAVIAWNARRDENSVAGATQSREHRPAQAEREAPGDTPFWEWRPILRR